MLSHGFVSAALFMFVGVVYDRMHSARSPPMAGSPTAMPIYATVFMLFTHGLGRPAGHQRLRRRDPGHRRRLPDRCLGRLFAATGMILGAAYMLWLYRRVVFGALVKRRAARHPRYAARTSWWRSRRWSSLAMVMGLSDRSLDPMHASP